ncbi:alpha/beta hydrolase [Brevundimonas sp. DC300-4]|uniref:alpha/beta hydrolase n=1 Tax=Brevundimonas sp. DC300-4 TaxID=2804594 RepID=UPI003CEFE901
MPPPDGSLDPDLATWLADPRIALSVPTDLTAFRAGANGYLARAPRPDIHAVEDVEITGPGGPLALRVYRPAAGPDRAIVVFLHGGAFVFGNLETHDAVCRRLALSSGLTLVAVDYRLAPEHPYPAGMDDAVAALDWVRSRFAGLPVELAGDSAGAWLAVATALMSAAVGQPVRGLALLYPAVDPGCASASQLALGRDHMLTRTFMLWAWQAYARDGMVDLMGCDLSALPSTTVITAGFDPLRDEGQALVERARAAGVEVRAHHYPDMIHGFAGLPQGSKRSDDAVARLAEGLIAALV